MVKTKLEYIWLDGHEPMQGLRSKTKVINSTVRDLEECPGWSFDGSSTEQAPGNSSDCLLNPVLMVPDMQRSHPGCSAYLVMCEVLNADGTPHKTNARSTITDDSIEFWFGYEQEYFLSNPKNGKMLGFPEEGLPCPQGQYYCSVGASNAFGRQVVEEHLDMCLEAGLGIEGINAEVAPGQWEFQLFAKGAKRAGDEMWLTRYLLERIAEKHGVAVNWHCKPLGTKADWNGSGMHTNFSNELLRTCGSQEVYSKVCEAFRPVVKEHIEVYGPDNHLRLTGKHETASIDQFTYGVSDRGASIRIPVATVKNGWNGWLEDRRPNSAADPYKIAARIIKTLKTVRL